jgi:arginine deiminase
LIRKTMAGINKNELPVLNKKSLSELVEGDYPFIADPMPNLYFTRDPFASIGNGISLNKMYSVTRNRETIYADYIFKYHPDFRDKVERFYDRDFEYHIEGGDILNLTENTIAIGISQRTEANAIEKIAKQIFFHSKNKNINTILAFNIPNTRAFMHLDTVFTQIDYDKFTIHPGIQGPLQVFEITKGDKLDELRIADEIGYTTPNKEARLEQPEEVRNNPNAYMPKEIMERCEIYVDLPKDVKKLYDNAWIQIKSSN